MKTEKNLVLCVLVFILFSSVQVRGQSSYKFPSDSFAQEEWSPNKLTYQDGLKKLRQIDNWYYSLSVPEREKRLAEYTISRNRLFIVTQEKRVASAVQSGFANSAFGTKSAKENLQKELLEEHANMRKLSSKFLNDTNYLKKSLFLNSQEMTGELPKDSGIKIESLSGQRVAKTNASMGGSYSGEGGLFKDLSSGIGKLSEQDLTDIFISKSECKPDRDPKCEEKKKQAKIRVAERKAREVKEKEQESIQRRIQGIVHGANRACQAPVGNTVDFKSALDSKKNPKIAKFLKAVGVSSQLSPQKSNDLSGWYGEPQTQHRKGEDPYATCVGHAIASNAAAVLHKKELQTQKNPVPKSISPDHAYSLALSLQLDGSKKQMAKINPHNANYCDPQAYVPNADYFRLGIPDFPKALSTFKHFPLCSNEHNSNEFYKIDQTETLKIEIGDPPPSFEVVKAMIDSGNPPMVVLKMDARKEQSGWIRSDEKGEFEHIFNIVGYNEGIDPTTLCPTKYFIVRDSLGKHAVHYNMPADDLLESLRSISHITKIHTETYKSSSPGTQRTNR